MRSWLACSGCGGSSAASNRKAPLSTSGRSSNSSSHWRNRTTVARAGDGDKQQSDSSSSTTPAAPAEAAVSTSSSKKSSKPSSSAAAAAAADDDSRSEASVDALLSDASALRGLLNVDLLEDDSSEPSVGASIAFELVRAALGVGLAIALGLDWEGARFDPYAFTVAAFFSGAPVASGVALLLVPWGDVPTSRQLLEMKQRLPVAVGRCVSVFAMSAGCGLWMPCMHESGFVIGISTRVRSAAAAIPAPLALLSIQPNNRPRCRKPHATTTTTTTHTTTTTTTTTTHNYSLGLSVTPKRGFLSDPVPNSWQSQVQALALVQAFFVEPWQLSQDVKDLQTRVRWFCGRLSVCLSLMKELRMWLAQGVRAVQQLMHPCQANPNQTRPNHEPNKPNHEPTPNRPQTDPKPTPQLKVLSLLDRIATTVADEILFRGCLAAWLASTLLAYAAAHPTDDTASPLFWLRALGLLTPTSALWAVGAGLMGVSFPSYLTKARGVQRFVRECAVDVDALFQAFEKPEQWLVRVRRGEVMGMEPPPLPDCFKAEWELAAEGEGVEEGGTAAASSSINTGSSSSSRSEQERNSGQAQAAAGGSGGAGVAVAEAPAAITTSSSSSSSAAAAAEAEAEAAPLPPVPPIDLQTLRGAVNSMYVLTRVESAPPVTINIDLTVGGGDDDERGSEKEQGSAKGGEGSKEEQGSAKGGKGSKGSEGSKEGEGSKGSEGSKEGEGSKGSEGSSGGEGSQGVGVASSKMIDYRLELLKQAIYEIEIGPTPEEVEEYKRTGRISKPRGFVNRKWEGSSSSSSGSSGSDGVGSSSNKVGSDIETTAAEAAAAAADVGTTSSSGGADEASADRGSSSRSEVDHATASDTDSDTDSDSDSETAPKWTNDLEQLSKDFWNTLNGSTSAPLRRAAVENAVRRSTLDALVTAEDVSVCACDWGWGLSGVGVLNLGVVILGEGGRGCVRQVEAAVGGSFGGSQRRQCRRGDAPLANQQRAWTSEPTTVPTPTNPNPITPPTNPQPSPPQLPPQPNPNPTPTSTPQPSRSPPAA